MEKYSCWYFPYSKRYYLTHPWKWFSSLRKNIRDVKMRARYGFCYGDVWDWNIWFMRVVPNMLRYMADHGSAYPGREPFSTPEKWHDWLHETADLIETGREDWQDEHNECYEEYMKHITEGWGNRRKQKGGGATYTREPSKLDDDYFARSKELGTQGEANVQRAIRGIAEHFYEIWD